MQTHKGTWSENKCWRISLSCPSISRSRQNTNTYSTTTKRNTSTCLLQQTCSFYCQNTFTLTSPKTCQLHVMFGKENVANKIVCFRMIFKMWSPIKFTNKLAVQHAELIKNHSYMCVIPSAEHLQEKVHQPETRSFGSLHMHVTAK